MIRILCHISRAAANAKIEHIDGDDPVTLKSALSALELVPGFNVRRGFSVFVMSFDGKAPIVYATHICHPTHERYDERQWVFLLTSPESAVQFR